MTTATRLPFDVATADFTPGVSLVEASAGTGKTFSLALSVVRLLVLRDAAGRAVVRDVGRLLVVTYTNAATDELVTRIRRVLRVAHDLYAGTTPAPESAEVPVLRTLTTEYTWAAERMRDALAALDTLSVHTIHGFCKRVLDEFALESGTPFATSLLQDESALVEDALRDWWRRTFYASPALAQYAVTQNLQPEMLAALWPLRHNWPDARLEPALDLAGFDRTLLDAVRAFATVWRRDDFDQRVQGLSWNKSATLTSPESRDDFAELLQWAAQLPVGHADLLHTVAPAIAALSAEPLCAAIAKRGDRAKAVVAELPSWSFVQRADAVAALLGDLAAVLRADAQRFAERAVEEAKRSSQQVGFSDLLRRLHSVLDAQGANGPLASALRAHFDAALIDEFQDTDRQQFAIFTTVFRDRPLILIGDPKQSIYGFRGADVRAYLDATHLAPESRQYALRKNFRSTGPMIGAVQQLFHRRRARPFLVDGVEYDEISAGKNHDAPGNAQQAPALHVMGLAADEDGAFLGIEAARTQALDATAQRIVALLAQGWTAGRIAVLVRTRHEGLRMESQLRDIGVPAVVSGLSNIFATTEAAELDTVLQAMATPRDSALLRAALATELWGATHAEIVALARGDAVGATDEATVSGWDAVVDTFVALRERWQREGLIVALHALFDRTQAMSRLLALADGDRRVTNVRHLVELLHRASSTQHLQIEGTLRWLAAERRAAIDGTHDGSLDTEESELRLETDADAVQILTVHKSKGLEYDIVFCPTLWQTRLPTVPFVVTDHGALGDAVLVHGEPVAPERLAHANLQRLAEELRLLYVALTRARFHTWIAWGAVRKGTARDQAALLRADGAAHSALAYLLCDDPTLDSVPALDVPQHVAAWWVQQGDWQTPVHALVRAGNRLIAFEEADEDIDGGAWQPSGPVAATRDVHVLPASPAPGVRFRTFQLSSYTMLARARAGDHADGDRALVRDTADGATASSTDEAEPPPLPIADWRALPPSDFRNFPAGAREGTVLHALFEETPFTDGATTIRARVADTLRGEPFMRDHFDERVSAVTDMMTRVLDAPFAVHERTVRLRDVVQRHARHEWQFTLPLASPAAPLTADTLADCFLHGDTASQRYAASLRTLDIRRVHGFLQGFIDLAFAHEGRWYVVDWKSNRLALDPATYADASLRDVMDAHHYTLQAHLYLVALHRFLRARAASPAAYDYDRDMGGAAYAFLRGFGEGASSTGHGWAIVRPARAVIDALDAVMGTTDPRSERIRA